jgi:chemotaxis protein methyltransferase CheR
LITAPGPATPTSTSRTAGRSIARTPPPDGAFVDQVATLIGSRTGLAFPDSRRGLLERAVSIWLDDMGPSTGTAALVALGQPDGAAWQRLVSLATIGETYFFRHREQLDAFRRVALPVLVEARRSLEPPVLRAWSAGCSSGEEAYSLAMLLEEALPDRARWQVRVVGTDIDGEALDRARTGVYGRWAFRAGGDERARWFRPVPGGERIEARIRDLVAFERHNLVDPGTPPPIALGGPADLVVCRNVTIYMSPEATRSVAARLYEALAPGGWLLVGPVEPSSETFQRFVSHHVDGITLYQRPSDERSRDRSRPAGAIATSRPVAPPAVAPPVAPTRPRDPAPRVAIADPPTLLGEARALADAGRLDEALARCQSALARDPRLPLGYALLATIAEARDDLEGACHALGRAAYLEPGDPLTQFRLGLLEWRRGRTVKARLRLRAAMSLLAGRPDTWLLDGHDGLTAGRARSVATTLLV